MLSYASSKIYSYETNYKTAEHWYKVAWGVELTMQDKRLLVGAMHHGDFLNYQICADEVVIIFDPLLINKVISSRQGLKSEWETKYSI